MVLRLRVDAHVQFPGISLLDHVVDPGVEERVVDTAMITMVERMQMLARLAAFCFIRYSMLDTLIKWLAL